MPVAQGRSAKDSPWGIRGGRPGISPLSPANISSRNTAARQGRTPNWHTELLFRDLRSWYAPAPAPSLPSAPALKVLPVPSVQHYNSPYL